jgi:small multidrug resistance pump
MFSPFVVLLAAIGIEVGATTVLPRTRGFHDLTWSVIVLGGYALSIWLLAIVVRQMSVSVAYAVWSGLGTAAIIVGVIVLNVHTPAASSHAAPHSGEVTAAHAAAPRQPEPCGCLVGPDGTSAGERRTPA